MWNGNVGKARAALLAASIASIAGCGIGVPPQASHGAAAPPNQPVQLRYQVDPARNRVWSLTDQGVFLHASATLERVQVHLPGWQWAGSPYGCPPDLALGPNGKAVITSDILPTLWRIDAESLAVSVHSPIVDADADKDFGFSALAYSPEQGAWFAVGLHGSLWRIDRLFTRAQKIALSAPLPKACGVAGDSRSASLRPSRLTGLCLRTAQGSWVIELSPDQRSAYARAAPCSAR
jgi:hypothetical protein